MLYTYGENGSMSPIDAAAVAAMGYGSRSDFEAAWTPGVLDAYKYRSDYYGLPFQYNIYSYAINRKHFMEAGLDPEKDYPKPWDDVFTLAEKLVVRKDGKISRQALSFPFSHSAAWYLLELEPIMRDLGGSVLNADQSECLINSAAGVKAMEILKKRFDMEVSEEAIALGLDYYNTGFPTGEFSMTVAGQWGAPRWYKNFADVTDGDDFMAIPYPTVKGGSNPPISTTSWAWVVSSGSKKKAEAWKLAEFITSMPSRNLLETGDTIPRAGWSSTEGAKSVPQSAFWEEMLQYSQPLANYKQYSEVSEPIKVAMQEILISGADIKDTLDDLKEEIDMVLQD
jgi:multiple sugar transport system substrate-binding protein